MLEPVFWCDDGFRQRMVAEVTRVRHFDRMSFLACHLLTAIVFHRHANAPSIFPAEIPGVANIGLEVSDDLAAEGAHWCGVVIKRAFKEFVGGNRWIESGLTKEIEGHFGLGDEKVPQVAREVGSHSRQDRQKMSFESANCTFGRIATMHVGRDQLKFGFPFLGDRLFVLDAGFVIQDLEVDGEASRFQALHDAVVSWDAVVVLARFEWASEDRIGVAVVGDHDVLVVAATPDGEAAGVVGEEPADMADLNMKFRRLFVWKWWFWVDRWESDGGGGRGSGFL